jgi:hypothetical protein
MKTIAALLMAAVFGSGTAQAQAGWDSVAAILKTPATDANGYKRFNLPRADLTIRVGDVVVSTPLAAGAWVGFAGTPEDADAMGDLVLIAAEVRPVEAQLVRDGIEISAVHDHLIGESPTLTYVHVHAHGVATALATKLARAVALTATPLPVTASPPPPLTIDTVRVFRALPLRGRARGAVMQFATVKVTDSVMVDGHPLVPGLAYATPINVQQVSPTRFLAAGDFALTAGGVQPVLQALIIEGLTVTAVHSHLVGESPTVTYIHFWADDTPERVFTALRAALQVAR